MAAATISFTGGNALFAEAAGFTGALAALTGLAARTGFDGFFAEGFDFDGAAFLATGFLAGFFVTAFFATGFAAFRDGAFLAAAISYLPLE